MSDPGIISIVHPVGFAGSGGSGGSGGSAEARRPDRRTRAQRHDLAVALALLATLLITAALRVRLLPVPLERDEGEYAYAGRLILQGVPPYAQAYSLKLPGIAACYALVMGAFGQTIVGIHFGLLLVNAASIVLVYLLGRRLMSDWAALASAIIFAAFSLCWAVQGSFANAEHFVLVPVLGGLLLLVGRAPPRAGRLFLAGLLLGLGFVIKQHAAAFIAWGGLYGVGRAWGGGAGLPEGSRWRRVGGRAAAFSAGALSPFLLTCALYLALDATSYPGIFHRFWFWAFGYASQYVREATLANGWENFNVWTPFRLSSPTLPLWLLALVGVAATACRLVRRSRALFLGGLAAFSFLAICPGLYFRAHYFVLTLPAIALWGGVGAVALHEAPARLGVRWAEGRTWMPAGLALLAAACTLFGSRDYLFRISPARIAQGVFRVDPFPEAVAIGQYIARHTSPDDRVLVLGSEPEILFYAKRRSATGFIYMYPMMEPQPYARQMQEQMIREVEASHPAMLVFVRIPDSWNAQADSEPLLEQWRRDYMVDNFQKTGLIDIADPDRPEVLWDEEAQRSPRAGPQWVTVYRRRDKPLRSQPESFTTETQRHGE